MGRWRGRATGLAIVAFVATASALAAGLAAFSPGTPPLGAGAPVPAWQLAIGATNGEVLLRVPLPDARFRLRYVNSLYGSLAEERFEIGPRGSIVLVELAADKPAVLDEYYSTVRPRPANPADSRRWRALPATPLTIKELVVAASQNSRRTLVVGGQAIPLWQLGGDGPPMVILRAERPG